MKKIMIGFLAAGFVFALTATVFAALESKQISVSYENIKVYVDQKPIALEDVNGNVVEPFIYNGTTYLPVRAIGEALGKEVLWDNQTKSVYIGSSQEAFRTGKLLFSTLDVNSEIGKQCSTEWFDFTVKSIKLVLSYAGYEPDSGRVLIDVVISETGTSGEPSTMGTFDFYVDAPTFEDYVYPIKAIDKTMMPDTFTLSKGQTVEYHMIYEVPKEMAGLVLIYSEVTEDNIIRNSFVFDAEV